MDLHPIIADRRDGRRQGAEAFIVLAQAAAACDLNRADGGGVPPYQIAAWLMAAYLNPLDQEETAALTLAMADSGARLDLTGLPHPWVDKHSTGGVGDKTTIALLPILAACGLTVVKMSGRGLGITGGTVDKLSSIPGFRLDLSPDEMIEQARRIGLALTGQTPNLAPADKTLYALRDATETVASIPLIVSSILSKKLAGGAEILGLDVKCGSGAFMKSLPEAQELSRWLIETARRCGLPAHVTISDMDQPLGRTAGNALEVREAFELLGMTSPEGRFAELVLHLAAETLVAVGKSSSMEAGRSLAMEAIAGGRAREKARQWIEAQGGDPLVVDTPNTLPTAAHIHTLTSTQAGFVYRVDAEAVGRAVLDLGGGRDSAADDIDLTVGVETLTLVGDEVVAGQPLFRIHSNSQESAERASERIMEGLQIGPSAIPKRSTILEVVR